jgi:hypothetical protein
VQTLVFVTHVGEEPAEVTEEVLLECHAHHLGSAARNDKAAAPDDVKHAARRDTAPWACNHLERM